MKPLYALIAQHKALEQLDPEEVDEQTLLATLEGLQGEITIKAQSCAAYVKNVEAFAEAVEQASKEMRARADRLYAKAEKVREYLIKQMDNLGTVKISNPELDIQIKKNPPSLVIEDKDKIPAQYKYQTLPTTEVDKMKVRDALDKGDVVPGARLHKGRRIAIK